MSLDFHCFYRRSLPNESLFRFCRHRFSGLTMTVYSGSIAFERFVHHRSFDETQCLGKRLCLCGTSCWIYFFGRRSAGEGITLTQNFLISVILKAVSILIGILYVIELCHNSRDGYFVISPPFIIILNLSKKK